MVLEQIMGARSLEKRPYVMFILGFIYAELGMLSALFVFPENPSLISIGFISLLLLPSLNSMLSMEENEEVREKRLSLKLLFKDHKDIISIYAALFLGILLAYAILALLLPENVNDRLFSVQLNILKQSYTGNAIAGYAAGSLTLDFFSILINNIKVLVICFIFSLVYGAGSILFLTWNASVWGAIFGTVAKTGGALGKNVVYLSQTLFAVFPHMISEAVAYFLAVIGGGIISKAVIKESINSKRFNHVVIDGSLFFGLAIVVLVVAAWLEVYIFPYLYGIF